LYNKVTFFELLLPAVNVNANVSHGFLCTQVCQRVLLALLLDFNSSTSPILSRQKTLRTPKIRGFVLISTLIAELFFIYRPLLLIFIKDPSRIPAALVAG
jgi:hypothetical protein